MVALPSLALDNSAQSPDDRRRMKRPAVFFDRDNTLIANDGYLGDPKGVVLIEGAADAIARARQLGYAAVVFTNQSGVARGMFTEERVHAVNARLDEMLLDQNPAAVIDRHEYCPYHPEAVVEAYRKDSELRKPKPGMILQAAQRLALDLSRSWVIGDAPRDVEAGHAAGCRTILFKDSNLLSSPAASAPPKVTPDYEVDSLHAAMAIIEMQTRSEIPAIVDQQPPAPAAVATEPVSASETAAAAHDSSAIIERIETLAEQILQEVRRGREQTHVEFSITKLMAGIVQVIALASLFAGWLMGYHDLSVVLQLALFLEALTIALLIMGRQR
jgi:D,D-heptose 1,7-bisphosphate phosphatase